ncbi:MAG: 50S ribosomal protein L10 [Gemmatales bacterium]|nr:50S ribosomal protein L10 [Gemmatales bacterium]MCS7159496.1 50S ribosomal protein L10 [Gemmatales bacterium]MDW8174695.1 50S ribosomal protein L10 [Gemmatales bacterium]MDW8223600.1 50S ribosomal protein L10 [Gemmatales bacterium]
MSKLVKQMEMDSLRKTLSGVQDLVLLNIQKLDARTTTQMRLDLRRKQIRLHMVKNTLAARVFQELGLEVPEDCWRGPTILAWGANSIAELAREMDQWATRIRSEKPQAVFEPKIAVVEKRSVPFEEAKRFPTREEALSQLVNLILAPATYLVGQLREPAARLVSQLKARGEQEQATS